MVIRDRRKVDATGRAKHAAESRDDADAKPGTGAASAGSTASGPDAPAGRSDAKGADDAAAEAGGGAEPAAETGGAKPAAGEPGTGEPEQPAVAEPAGTEAPAGESTAAEPGATDPSPAQPVEVPAQPVADEDAEPGAEPDGKAAGATPESELESVRAELAERTRDLQRVTAEYANYRKRVDRDRSLAAEQTTGAVLSTLLPVLDDLDRARDHGDLVGPFGSVAEQLIAALGKFGLTPFGEKGDAFDPTRHEAVAHTTSAEVTEPTCVDVMRRGYLLGERLLRPAMVAVADPE
nr:nucleotide exchange factor GrpE [Micromonospora sp. NBRC 107566]